MRLSPAIRRASILTDSLRKIDGNSTEVPSFNASSGWFSHLKICGTLYYIKTIQRSLKLQTKGLWRYFPRCPKNPAPWILVLILLKLCTVTYILVEEAWVQSFKDIKDRLTFVLGANKHQWIFSCVSIFIMIVTFIFFFECSSYQVPYVFRVLSNFFFVNLIIFSV